MKKLIAKLWLQHGIFLCLCLGLLIFVIACSPGDRPLNISGSLNSRYTDEQPALSGNGRYIAFLSNRNHSRHLLLYDLQEQVFIPTPHLQNRPGAIAQHPSLSYTGRYLVCIVNEYNKLNLVLYDRVTQQPQILNQWYQGLVRNPSISPNGRYIVFESSLHDRWDIEVLDRGAQIELDIPDGAAIKE